MVCLPTPASVATASIEPCANQTSGGFRAGGVSLHDMTRSCSCCTWAFCSPRWTFRRLVALVASLDEEETRATREGLSEDELALFDLLQKDGLSKADRERVKHAPQNQSRWVRYGSAGPKRRLGDPSAELKSAFLTFG